MSQDLANPSDCSTGSCRSSTTPTNPLPQSVQERVAQHPCYSEQAHRHYARMHLPVAPACNIQCHYCNRKYDCSNESRPGVVSGLLRPAEAADKVRRVAAAIPQLSVVGIAGPGDPLANPEWTFEAFERIAASQPDLRLCLSTNGLRLAEHIDTIVRLNIDHVTITINAIDPDIAAQIYPWIYWDHRRLRGREAAQVLINQQKKGLEQLVARGILVKINSVLIPGVNDAHLPAVARYVRDRGAFLHNVMPLISDPAHGTFYGLNGYRGPTDAELEAARAACGTDMRMMRHCQQCRADAVGFLGDDADPADSGLTGETTAESPETSRVAATRDQSNPEGLQIAVASDDARRVDQGFRAARSFRVYRVQGGRARFVESRRVLEAMTHPSATEDTHEDQKVAIHRRTRLLGDCDAALCANIGYEAWQALEAADIRPNGEWAGQTIEAAIDGFLKQMHAGLEPVAIADQELAGSA